MAIQGNESQVFNALGGAAGKNNYGAGGDYFTPGRHVVEVMETTAGPSGNLQKKNVINVILGARVLESEGRESTIWLQDGKVVRRPESCMVPAIKRGSERKQILTSDKLNFDNDLGNFCLAAKRTFIAKFDLCEEADLLSDFLRERWSPDQQTQVRAFVDRARKSMDTTTQADIQDIFKLDLALGLVMHVEAGEKSNKNADVVLTPLSWKAGSVEEQQKAGQSADD